MAVIDNPKTARQQGLATNLGRVTRGKTHNRGNRKHQRYQEHDPPQTHWSHPRVRHAIESADRGGDEKGLA